MNKELLQEIKRNLPYCSVSIIARRLKLNPSTVSRVLNGAEIKHANAIITEALAIIKASQEEKARIEGIANNLLNPSSNGNN